MVRDLIAKEMVTYWKFEVYEKFCFVLVIKGTNILASRGPK